MCSGADQISNNPATSLGVAGAMLSGISNLVAGDAARQAGNATRGAAYYRAAQLEQNAGNTMAMGERQAADERLKATLLASRALAVAAASGGGASDPTVTKIITDIAGRGAYNAGIALYNAEDEARKMTEGAAAERYSGDVAQMGGRQRQAAYQIGAAGRFAQGASLFSKYGRNGPRGAQDDPFDLNT